MDGTTKYLENKDVVEVGEVKSYTIDVADNSFLLFSNYRKKN